MVNSCLTVALEGTLDSPLGQSLLMKTEPGTNSVALPTDCLKKVPKLHVISAIAAPEAY